MVKNVLKIVFIVFTLQNDNILIAYSRN